MQQDADRQLDELQRDLARLCRESVEAGQAAAAQDEYYALRETVSERLRALEGFKASGELAANALADWRAGDWEQATRGFGHAAQTLETWRAKNETAEERIARTDGPQRERELRNQLEQTASERGGLRETVRQRDAQVAELNRQWHEDRGKFAQQYSDLGKKRDELENQLASERKRLYALTTEKLDLASQLAAAHGERKQAKQDADSWRANAEAQQKRADDMHGNVAEWSGDFFSLRYYKETPPQDPQGHDSGISRVIRGGSWHSTAPKARSALREPRSPLASDRDIGFRVVCDICAWTQ